MNAGADIQAEDAAGRTALDHALGKGLKRIPDIFRARETGR